MSGAAAGPRISIVISVLNGAATLERCLASVLEQDWPATETIVIDGGSTDGTPALLERFRPHLAWCESKPDRGIYHAWNKALDHATGDWIGFLGADDRIRDRRVLARLAPVLAESAGRWLVVYASVDVVDAAGRVRATVGRPWPEAAPAFRHHMAIPHQATFHHRTLFERHGRFDESYRVCGDYELLLRELVRGDARFVPGPAAVAMQEGGLSDRPASLVTMAEEFARARFKHGLTPVPPALAPPVWRARCRRALTRSFGPRAAEAVAAVYRRLAGMPRRASRP